MPVLGGADGFVLRVAGLVFSVDATGIVCVGRLLPKSCLEQNMSRLRPFILALHQNKLAFDESPLFECCLERRK